MEIREFQITDAEIVRMRGYGNYSINIEVLHNDVFKEVIFNSHDSQLFDDRDADDIKERLILSVGGEDAIYNALND
jgi:hypothetical protein